MNTFTEPMSFLVGSELTVDFSTHLCNDGNSACSVVLQYYCTPNDTSSDSLIRDGQSVNSITADNFNEMGESGLKFGMHESIHYGRRCAARQRNTQVYTANRPLNGDTAQFTRQNSGGSRYGFECAEERDYYPYWHPAPWKDIAVLLQNHSAAECARVQAQSQNVVPTGHCEPKSDTATMTEKEAAWRFNNKAACETGGNDWRVTPANGLAPPFCGVMPSGSAFSHTINLPDEPSCVGKAGSACVCVMRLRLNVTVPGVDSGLLKQDMTVTVAGKPLSLALNTNQVGRTFEDRSHAFVLRARPADVPSTQRVVNLNVRGKRGNFVQVFPAVQYDFVPRHVVLEVGDAVHFQWTGFDNNPNNGGNNAEGASGTDRSNICQTESIASLTCLCDDCFGGRVPLFAKTEDRARFAVAGQKDSDCDTLETLKQKHNNNIDAMNEDPRNCMKLNAAPAHFDGGVVTYSQLGTMTFMSTRNSNFANRLQTGSIAVVGRGMLPDTPKPAAPPGPGATTSAPATACTSASQEIGISVSVIVSAIAIVLWVARN